MSSKDKTSNSPIGKLKNTIKTSDDNYNHSDDDSKPEIYLSGDEAEPESDSDDDFEEPGTHDYTGIGSDSFPQSNSQQSDEKTVPHSEIPSNTSNETVIPSVMRMGTSILSAPFAYLNPSTYIPINDIADYSYNVMGMVTSPIDFFWHFASMVLVFSYSTTLHCLLFFVQLLPESVRPSNETVQTCLRICVLLLAATIIICIIGAILSWCGFISYMGIYYYMRPAPPVTVPIHFDFTNQHQHQDPHQIMNQNPYYLKNNQYTDYAQHRVSHDYISSDIHSKDRDSYNSYVPNPYNPLDMNPLLRSANGIYIPTLTGPSSVIQLAPPEVLSLEMLDHHQLQHQHQHQLQHRHQTNNIEQNNKDSENDNDPMNKAYTETRASDLLSGITSYFMTNTNTNTNSNTNTNINTNTKGSTPRRNFYPPSPPPLSASLSHELSKLQLPLSSISSPSSSPHLHYSSLQQTPLNSLLKADEDYDVILHLTTPNAPYSTSLPSILTNTLSIRDRPAYSASVSGYNPQNHHTLHVDSVLTVHASLLSSPRYNPYNPPSIYSQNYGTGTPLLSSSFSFSPFAQYSTQYPLKTHRHSLSSLSQQDEILAYTRTIMDVDPTLLTCAAHGCHHRHVTQQQADGLFISLVKLTWTIITYTPLYLMCVWGWTWFTSVTYFVSTPWRLCMVLWHALEDLFGLSTTLVTHSLPLFVDYHVLRSKSPQAMYVNIAGPSAFDLTIIDAHLSIVKRLEGIQYYMSRNPYISAVVGTWVCSVIIAILIIIGGAYYYHRQQQLQLQEMLKSGEDPYEANYHTNNRQKRDNQSGKRFVGDVPSNTDTNIDSYDQFKHSSKTKDKRSTDDLQTPDDSNLPVSRLTFSSLLMESRNSNHEVGSKSNTFSQISARQQFYNRLSELWTFTPMEANNSTLMKEGENWENDETDSKDSDSDSDSDSGNGDVHNELSLGEDERSDSHFSSGDDSEGIYEGEGGYEQEFNGMYGSIHSQALRQRERLEKLNQNRQGNTGTEKSKHENNTKTPNQQEESQEGYDLIEDFAQSFMDNREKSNSENTNELTRRM